MFFITGDKHGEFTGIKQFCQKAETTPEDVLIILGDAGINYFLDERDELIKNYINILPITLFCIHGNHEARPETIRGYEEVEMFGGRVYRDEIYPNQIFAKDGEIYEFNKKKVLVIGGAYSPDKNLRLLTGAHWFPDEQPSEESKERAKVNLEKHNWKVDFILSHTCPYRYRPLEWFVGWVNQNTVDNTTELFLDDIEARTSYERWFCGHFHGEKRIDKMQFLFNSFLTLC